MNFDDLLKMGYKEYKPSPFYSAQRACQKRIDDSKGNILYFLSVYFYRHEYDNKDRYEVHMQLYQQGTHKPLDLNFFDDWDIKDVEHYADMLYHTGVTPSFEPYEERNYD